MAFFREGQPFAMDQPPHVTMYLNPDHYASYLQQQSHQQSAFNPEPMYQSYPFLDYADFSLPGLLHEEYDDSSEISTRPRLTKDQVEVLESQFQSHPKPNSMVKKQLAIQTKLTLPRVANWFQNRRAKAKQQRKQEEYEIQQSMNAASGWKSESETENDKQDASDTSSKTASPGMYSTSTTVQRGDTKSASPVPPKPVNKEPSYLSLQRAMSSAKAGQPFPRQDLDSAGSSMPPPEARRSTPAIDQLPNTVRSSHINMADLPEEWSKPIERTDAWVSSTSPPSVSHAAFDFGFDQPAAAIAPEDLASDEEVCADSHAFILSPGNWPRPHRIPIQQPSEYGSLLSRPMPLPIYDNSRRGSGSEELTTNFGSFALRGTPPMGLGHLDRAMPTRGTEGEIDIASRRKRPRPAAISTHSLRSRSYGNLNSASPSFRAAQVGGGQLRHAKSAGHGLNAQYSGIRKSSLPQKSPLNMHSFVEAEAEAEALKAEAFKNLMAQQSALVAASNSGLDSADLSMPNTARYSESVATAVQAPSEMMPHFKHLQSPPVTPFQSDFLMQASGIGMQPVSASSQFPNSIEYTPPYSAGPLTNSTCSWSDAPLHSPELAIFPTGTYMSSLPFNQDSVFPQWVLPSDNMAETHPVNMSEEKKTEFYITEFPGQKEEHFNALQKASQQKPKNYTFANTAPSDYDS